MTIRILPSAVADLRDGREFYESREVGLGDYFQDCLFSDIESLVLHAGLHRKVFGFHRLLSKRFPYAIYYQIDAGMDAVVYRILDCRRDPKRIRDSLGQS
ncbi:MAG: type II toxin-antitoxin system RelE/ParE family toxin [Verrucomicrobiota bacterium]